MNTPSFASLLARLLPQYHLAFSCLLYITVIFSRYLSHPPFSSYIPTCLPTNLSTYLTFYLLFTCAPFTPTLPLPPARYLPSLSLYFSRFAPYLINTPSSLPLRPSPRAAVTRQGEAAQAGRKLGTVGSVSVGAWSGGRTCALFLLSPTIARHRLCSSTPEVLSGSRCREFQCPVKPWY